MKYEIAAPKESLQETLKLLSYADKKTFQSSLPHPRNCGHNSCGITLGQVPHLRPQLQRSDWKVPEPFQEPEPHHRHGYSSICPPPHSHFLHRAPLRLALPQDALRL